MKKLVCAFCAVFMIACLLFAGGCAKSKESINVFNWGEYIETDLLDEFEQETGIHINYTTVSTCEEMYAKMKNGGVNYDIVVPSDYMISRMIEEGMIQKINFKNVPNFKYVDKEFVDPEYDPQNEYSVPYQWNTVGVVYNKKVVKDSEKDIGSWDLLWNKKYRKQILMLDNSRDALGIALKRMGESYNTTDTKKIQEAGDMLLEQKPLVQAYVIDQIFDKMEGEEAAISPCYSGDYVLICDDVGEKEAKNFGFYFPKEGTNLFVDAMCIPKDSQNKSGAEKFINFICRPDNMARNTEAIYYSTAESAARELMPDELRYNEVMYPSQEQLAQTETFVNLPVKCRRLYDKLWIQLMSA